MSCGTGRARLALVGLAGCALTLALGTAAVAAQPAKGKEYRGSAPHYGPVSFVVSKNGQRVIKLIAPARCGNWKATQQKPLTATITKRGTFKARTRLAFQEHGMGRTYNGSITVRGKFQSHGKERGEIAVHVAKVACFAEPGYRTHD